MSSDINCVSRRYDLQRQHSSDRFFGNGGNKVQIMCKATYSISYEENKMGLSQSIKITYHLFLIRILFLFCFFFTVFEFWSELAVIKA